jgi:rRNA maturation RNase YbeY
MIPPDFPQDQIIFNFISSESILDDTESFRKWLLDTIIEEDKKLYQINYIFCDDAYLLDINKKYLDHDDYTDIITFPYQADPIESDIFISLERVDENAKDRNINFMVELKRVMIHGVLHLCGYGDKTESEKNEMRKKEDYYLQKM